MNLRTRQPTPASTTPASSGAPASAAPASAAPASTTPASSGGRGVVPLLVVVVVVVVLGAVVGRGLFLLADGDQGASGGAWASPSARPSAVAGAVATGLAAEEQALREAALATSRPQRPAGMDQPTPEGAAAAAEYFLSLYSYAYATGDLSQWHAMSQPGCEFCQLVADKVDELHQDCGWADPWTDSVTAQSWGYDESGSILVVEVSVSSPQRTIHRSNGTEVWAMEQARLQMQMTWTDEGWLVHGSAVR